MSDNKRTAYFVSAGVMQRSLPRRVLPNTKMRIYRRLREWEVTRTVTWSLLLYGSALAAQPGDHTLFLSKPGLPTPRQFDILNNY